MESKKQSLQLKSYSPVVIDLDEWAQEWGYNDFRDVVKQCIEGGFGDNWYFAAKRVEKEFEDKYGNDEESEESEQALDTMVERLNDNLTNMVVEVLAAALDTD